MGAVAASVVFWAIANPAWLLLKADGTAEAAACSGACGASGVSSAVAAPEVITPQVCTLPFEIPCVLEN